MKEEVDSEMGLELNMLIISLRCQLKCKRKRANDGGMVKPDELGVNA